MEDVDRLLAEAKKRGIAVIMDLVVNHCSDEHEWFRRACEDPDGPYGRFFYIREWHEGEPYPCNWRSYFGGPCWDLLPGHTDRIYFHAFHKKQPDLNWENPELRQAVYDMINWWLDKGVAGFRIDAIINIKKFLPFQDFPADRDDGMCSVREMLARAKGVTVFLEEMADRTFRPHDAFTVGEVFDEKEEELPLFIGEHGCFSTMFDFSGTLLNKSPRGWYDQAPPTMEQFKHTFFASQRRTEKVGFLATILENHDEPRGVSFFLPPEGRSETGKKMLGALSFFLRGLPFLYQGQEIGMENTLIRDIAEVDDISTLDEYRVALDAGLSPAEALAAVARLSRDNARTPMQWDGGINAGFSAGTPWLPVNPNYTNINLAEQRSRLDSLWQFYREMIRIRKDPELAETVVYGALEPYLEEREGLMAYFRRGGRTLLAAGNCTGEALRMPLPGPVRRVILNNMGQYREQAGELLLAPWQFVLLEV